MAATREIGVPELAYHLGCTIPVAQALVRTGRISGHKAARGWVTTLEAMNGYLARHPRKPSSKLEERAA
jgi:hypothetical protein